MHEAFEHTGVATAAQDAAADAAIDNVEQALQDNSDGLFPVSEEVKAEEAVEDEAVEQATDLLIDGLEDAGNDTQGLEGDI